MSGLERAVDLSGLLEEPQFLEAFCGGCPQAPRYFFEDCPTGGDPADERCWRRRAFLIIDEALDKAEELIIDTMRGAGCVTV